MGSKRLKFATQVDSALLSDVRAIAEREGRQLQSVVEEALTDLVEKKLRGRVRPAVTAHYEASLQQFSDVYRHLAK